MSAARRGSREAAPVPDSVGNPDWQGILEAALTLEGSVGNTYRRLYAYSMGNIAFLMYQGVLPQPVATFKRWTEVDRHVKAGSHAFYILRPIKVTLKDKLDDEGNPLVIQRYKPVKSVFPISMTEGEPLPEVELPDWSKSRAMANLDITEVPFQDFDPNIQGYSLDRSIAINPAARFPEKTMAHELAHVVLGHTATQVTDLDNLPRSLKEVTAESTAHLVTTELGLMTPDAASVSRGYIQGWRGSTELGGTVVRSIFKATDEIVQAGRPDNYGKPAPIEV